MTIPNGIQRRDRRHRREGLRVRACTDLFKTYRWCDDRVYGSDTVALVADVTSPALTVDDVAISGCMKAPQESQRLRVKS